MKPHEPEPVVVGRFTAKFQQDCFGCEFNIEPGQQMVKFSNKAVYHDYCEP